MRTYFFIFIILYLIANLVTVILYKVDKVKAVKKSWRIKEKVLLSFGFFFGAFGALFAMHTFRHKTKHWYFVFGMPAILLIQIILGILIVRSGISL